jgi:hypothetical protein
MNGNSISARQAGNMPTKIFFFAWEMLVTPFSNSDSPVLLSKERLTEGLVTSLTAPFCFLMRLIVPVAGAFAPQHPSRRLFAMLFNASMQPTPFSSVLFDGSMQPSFVL